MSDREQRRRLPVGQTIWASYLVLVRNLPLAARLATVPLLVALSLFAAEYFIPASPETGTGGGLLWPTLLIAFGLIFAVSIIPPITAWHRLVLLGYDHPDPRLGFQLALPEWTYAWRSVALMALMMIAWTPLLLGLALLFELGGMATPFIVLVYGIVALILMLRLCLALPSAALGSRFSFRDSWRATRGNAGRIALAFLAGELPIWIVSDPAVLLEHAGVDLSVTVRTALDVLTLPLWIASFLVAASIWSWAYRYLVEGKDIVLPGERAA